MTSKEKAIELVNKYKYPEGLLTDKTAKQCAKIDCDEILEIRQSLPTADELHYDYWSRVKIEIKNL